MKVRHGQFSVFVVHKNRFEFLHHFFLYVGIAGDKEQSPTHRGRSRVVPLNPKV